MKNTNILQLVSIVAIFAAPIAMTGCSSTGVGNPPLTPEEEALVSDSNDSEETGTTASSLVALPTLAITRLDIGTPALAATKAIQSASATYLGTDKCATATQISPTEIDYTLSGCTGPLGLVLASGTLKATFTSPSAGIIQIDVVDGGDLQLNGKPATEKATALVSFSGSQRIIHWDGQFEGLTLKNRPVSQDAHYNITVENTTPHTVTIDGNSTTTVDFKTGKDKGVSLNIKNYVHSGPKAKCATSGHITATPIPNPKPVSIVVDFLGGASAQITYFRGTKSYTTDVALGCTP